jgi:ATP-dependent Clp protease ATP-binding subunit ClpC
VFERYNKKARRALFFARWEAIRFASPTIESEHLVLGLLREGEKIVNKLWRAFSIDPAVLRREIEAERLPLKNASSTTERL